MLPVKFHVAEPVMITPPAPLIAPLVLPVDIPDNVKVLPVDTVPEVMATLAVVGFKTVAPVTFSKGINREYPLPPVILMVCAPVVTFPLAGARVKTLLLAEVFERFTSIWKGMAPVTARLAMLNVTLPLLRNAKTEPPTAGATVTAELAMALGSAICKYEP